VSLNINNQKHLLRALADSGARSSIILEECTFKNLIQRDKNNRTTWSTMGVQFITDKTGLMNFSLPEFYLKQQISCKFHVDDHSKSSSTFDLIIGQYLLGEFGIILNINERHRHS
jgi:hypothetical protein